MDKIVKALLGTTCLVALCAMPAKATTIAEIEDNDTFGTAQVIAADMDPMFITGFFRTQPTADVFDWFQITGLSGGQQFFIEYNQTSSSNAVSFLESGFTVYDSDSDFLVGGSIAVGGPPITISGIIPTDGILYVQAEGLLSPVFDNESGASVGYQLTLDAPLTAVPEPSAAALFGTGLLVLGGAAAASRRRKRRDGEVEQEEPETQSGLALS